MKQLRRLADRKLVVESTALRGWRKLRALLSVLVQSETCALLTTRTWLDSGIDRMRQTKSGFSVSGNMSFRWCLPT